MIPGSANPLLLADAGYQIQRSLRFRSSASAYLARTPASNGNRQKFTFSYWAKRGTLSAAQEMYFMNAGGGTFSQFSFTASNAITFASVTSSAADIELATAAVYRDPSAWYHIILSVDTTQATSTNRVLLYVNGVLQTMSGTYPAQNYNCQLNTTTAQNIGRPTTGTFDGYLTEYNFIDGQALTPSSFGEISPTTGQWQAKKYSGTYGTNGFYLPFTDNSAATATAIGADKSGNDNNWTPNNISLTAGATYDSMLDVPLGAGGAERGNYATWNPIATLGSTNNILRNGNLDVTSAVGQVAINESTIVTPTSGAFYFEWTLTTFSTADCLCGMALNPSVGINTANVFYSTKSTNVASGLYVSGALVFAQAMVVNDVVGFSLDVTNSILGYYLNGVLKHTASSVSLGSKALGMFLSQANAMSINFGQRPFAYTPPTGFKALHTGNLPDPVIKLPAQYMAATTYTGNGASQSISNAVNGVGFQPDLVWVKSRSGAFSNHLEDTVRGLNNALTSNGTSAEYSGSANYGSVSGVSLAGFSVAAGSLGAQETNQNTTAFVGWQWKANGAAVSNTAGSITSQVSAGVSQGFSVVTFTAQASGTGTVGHGLGVAPAMIITKQRATVGTSWTTYHASVGNTAYLVLNTTAASATLSTVWNNTSPTSSVFSLGTAFAGASTMVAYCFAPVAGYSAFGKYTGNGSADGPFVFTGFRPRFVMIKQTSGASDWWIWDTARETYNQMSSPLYPNTSVAEASYAVFNFDILSNGFKMRSTNPTVNGSGLNYVFACFAESPFKNSLAR